MILLSHLLNILLVTAMHLPNAGTYWYHSHLSTQYLDGLRGAIVIYVRR
jgi:FtsP/CotA-like multicopper oxidase with cupredoxin domain